MEWLVRLGEGVSMHLMLVHDLVALRMRAISGMNGSPDVDSPN